MKRQNMSLETQLKGVIKAIDSPRTPRHLKKASGRRAAELQEKLRKKSSGSFLRRLRF